ncbi:general transcription factor IIE subunit 1-like [Tubulanus polymorphus]|uniref:general transcription factor IIE subunit 1-like n=1 Tax=Tubulanus polymorphus TaxID=672921 RepID=UPI003DA58746
MSEIKEPDILTEVPETLKRLARYIVRGFYDQEHAIVIDLLVRNPCMKEDDLVELLKFERKQLRTLINTLKNDKFLKIRMRVETDAEGKTTRHNYYFINYKVFVNVVKYKLDHMRRKIETEERDSTNRASFHCPSCQKSFTDLEVDRLFDPMTGTYQCYFCHLDVIEDEPVNPVHDTRTLMAKFNNQMQPIYDLLRQCEDIKLAPEVLDPEPIDIKSINSRAPGASKRDPNDHSVWSGDIKKNIGFEVRENTVTVNMDTDNKSIITESKPEKARPIWMTESTVEGAMLEPVLGPKVEISSEPAGPSTAPPGGSSSRKMDDDHIMRTLLVHEKKNSQQTALATPALVPAAPQGGASSGEDDSSTSESEDEIEKAVVKSSLRTTVSRDADVEEMESDDDDGEDEMLVAIGDKKIAFNDVTAEHVQQMTKEEKAEYIRIGQEIHEHMYD